MKDSNMKHYENLLLMGMQIFWIVMAMGFVLAQKDYGAGIASFNVATTIGIAIRLNRKEMNK